MSTTTMKQSRAATALKLPALPDELAGWRWDYSEALHEWRLIHPNGSSTWDTKGYQKPEKAIAEAQRYLLSKPSTKGAKRVEYVKLDFIRTDGGTQARAGLDEATVAEYAETWQTLSYQANGLSVIPPIVVYYDGSAYWLADGFHRVEAYKRFLRDGTPSASPHALRAEIRQGTRRDAVLYACGANAAHGLRRTNADKRRAVETLLRDEEWRQWSDRKIAEACAVSDKTAAAVRNELIAGAEIPHVTERQGTDGKVYTAPAQAAAGADEPATPADQRAALEARGWSFIPTSSPRGWFRLVHPELSYVRQEPSIEDAIKAAADLQSGYDRKAQLRQQAADRQAQIASGAPALPDDIRQAAGRLELLIQTEPDGWIFHWPEESTDGMDPMDAAVAREWLEREGPGMALNRLSRLLPADLGAAGYAWESVTPFTLTRSDGVSVDAPTSERAIDLAREQLHATRSQRTILLPLDMQQRLVSVGAAIFPDGSVMPPKGVDEPTIVMDAQAAKAAIARWAALKLSAPAIPVAPAIDWNAVARESYRLGARASTAEAWITLGNIIRLLSPSDVAAAIRWLLIEADVLAGDHLEDLAEKLDDAAYEALACYRRDRSVAA